MRLVGRATAAPEPMVALQRVGRELSRRYGRRAEYFCAGSWHPVDDRGVMLGVKERVGGGLAVPIRVVPGYAGRFRVIRSGFLALSLDLPADDEATAREVLHALADSLSFDAAALGPSEPRDLVGVWTYRKESPVGACPAGIRDERWHSGRAFLAPAPEDRDSLRSWLAGRVVPAAAERPAPAPKAQLLAVPSYLKALGDPAPTLSPSESAAAAPMAAAPPESGPDETVLGGVPTAAAVPFLGSLAAPPAATPIEAASDAGGTVVVPLPEQLRVSDARASTFDPDLTQPVVPNPLPVIPFFGTTTPERIRQIAGSPPVEPSDQSGETAYLPLPDELRGYAGDGSSSPVDLPLPEYAALRAAAMALGEDDPSVLARFGLRAADKLRLQQVYFERFRADVKLREAFEALLREEMRKINRGIGGRK